MMENFLLPVGSVVLLNEGKKRLLIYGVLQKPSNSDVVYDYIGCYYPEGFINQEHSFLFNTSDISEISYIGFVDSEYQVFDTKLREKIKKMKLAKEENF